MYNSCCCGAWILLCCAQCYPEPYHVNAMHIIILNYVNAKCGRNLINCAQPPHHKLCPINITEYNTSIGACPGTGTSAGTGTDDHFATQPCNIKHTCLHPWPKCGLKRELVHYHLTCCWSRRVAVIHTAFPRMSYSVWLFLHVARFMRRDTCFDCCTCELNVQR